MTALTSRQFPMTIFRERITFLIVIPLILANGFPPHVGWKNLVRVVSLRLHGITVMLIVK